MGLFFGKKKTPLDIPRGDVELTVYTYNGKPFGRLKPKVPITLEVVGRVVTMTSIYTGTKWQGEGALSYRGQIIGYVTDGPTLDELMRLRKAHSKVTVSAIIKRKPVGSWPYVVIRVPHLSELRRMV